MAFQTDLKLMPTQHYTLFCTLYIIALFATHTLFHVTN